MGFIVDAVDIDLSISLSERELQDLPYVSNSELNLILKRTTLSVSLSLFYFGLVISVSLNSDKKSRNLPSSYLFLRLGRSSFALLTILYLRFVQRIIFYLSCQKYFILPLLTLLLFLLDYTHYTHLMYS